MQDKALLLFASAVLFSQKFYSGFTSFKLQVSCWNIWVRWSIV